MTNGEPKRNVKPTRGLGQGNPLSPYLFLLSIEDLINLLHHPEFQKSITGVHLCRSAPRLNHLLFSNDSLLFCKANMVENYAIHNILKLYEQASRQQINRSKTTNMTISKNVCPEIRRQIIMDFWNVPEE